MKITTSLLFIAALLVGGLYSCGPSKTEIQLQQLKDSLRQQEAVEKAVEKVKQELGATAAAPAAKPANVERPSGQISTPRKSGTYVKVLRRNVMLRSYASTDAPAYKSCYPGNEFAYVGNDGDWYMVSYHGGIAYIYGGYYNGHRLADVVTY